MCFMRLGLHYGVPHYTVTIRRTQVADAGCVCDRGDHPPPWNVDDVTRAMSKGGGGVLVNVQEWGLGVFFNLSEGG